MSEARYESETLDMFLGFLERKGLSAVIPVDFPDEHLKGIDGAVCLSLQKTGCRRNAFRAVFKEGLVAGGGWRFRGEY